MARRSAARGAHAPLAFACLLGTACASAPAPIVTVAPDPIVSRDTKIGWTFRLEQERRVRDAGLVVAPPAGGTVSFQAATTPALDALAFDPDPVVRRRAVLAIGRVGAVELVPHVTAALRDPEEQVRAAAAFGLGLFGREGQEAVPPLLLALADSSLLVRTRAIDALGLIGEPSAVPAIYQAAAGCGTRLAAIEPDAEQVTEPEVELCRAALFAFVRLQNFDAIAGVTLNSQGEPVSRWWPAAYALQRINDKRAVPALTVLARTPGVYTASFALRGLANFKEPALVPIARALGGQRTADVKVRVAAVRALGAAGGEAGAAALMALLDMPGLPHVLTLEVLAALGATRHAPAFDVLIDYLTDPQPAVRATALTAAAAASPEAFLVVLAGLDRDRDWSVRAALARALPTLPSARVMASLAELAADDDARVRAPALEALAAVKAPDIESRLFKALEAADYVERATAARLIGELKIDGAAPRLVTAYERGQSDATYDARAAALTALAAFGGDEVRTILRRGLGDRDWPVRWRTAELLRGLGDASAVPERPARLRTPPEWFQSEALLRPAFSPHAYVETRAGTIQIELDMVDGAVTSRNFIELARNGFFNGMKLHRVVPAFVVQGGDPRGDGAGGPGYTIPDELSWKPFVRGTVGMALAWRDTGGSQFFITLSPQPHLDGKYTVFGRVIEGWSVLDQLAPWDVIDRVRVWDGVSFD